MTKEEIKAIRNSFDRWVTQTAREHRESNVTIEGVITSYILNI